MPKGGRYRNALHTRPRLSRRSHTRGTVRTNTHKHRSATSTSTTATHTTEVGRIGRAICACAKKTKGNAFCLAIAFGKEPWLLSSWSIGGRMCQRRTRPQEVGTYILMPYSFTHWHIYSLFGPFTYASRIRIVAHPFRRCVANWRTVRHVGQPVMPAWRKSGRNNYAADIADEEKLDIALRWFY